MTVYNHLLFHFWWEKKWQLNFILLWETELFTIKTKFSISVQWFTETSLIWDEVDGVASKGLLIKPFIPVQAANQAAKPITSLIRLVYSWEWMPAHGYPNRISSGELLPSLSIERDPRITSRILGNLSIQVEPSSIKTLSYKKLKENAFDSCVIL